MSDMNIANAIFFENRKTFRSWLEKHHGTSKGIWIIHYKKSSNKNGLNHDDAVIEALCFGWIDSKLKSIDTDRYMLRYSPRKSKSLWSKINKEKAEVLIASGKMTESGFEQIRLAKMHGLWDIAYTNYTKEQLPSDLRQALLKDELAWKNFGNFANSYRNNYIGWVNMAKTDVTRLRRIHEVVRRSRGNKKQGDD